VRIVLVTIVGFLFGCALVLVALYYNPFTANSGVIVSVNARVLTYRSPFTEGLAVTHGGQSRLPLQPALISALWENTIKNSMLSVVVLHDEEHVPVGIASRVSQLSERTEMLTRGVLIDDDWLVTIPSEGSFFIQADSNLWPFLRDTLIPVWYLDRSWQGPKSYRPTTGPADGGAAIVAGATGRFANREGTAVESYQISDFNQTVGPGRMDVRLFLRLP
jgi:hypothetical protein